jgi:mannose-6-phosphate isomerase-like protein (cupin superfamily)
LRECVSYKEEKRWSNQGSSPLSFISVPDPKAYMRSPTGNRIAIRADRTQTGGLFALLETEDVTGAATPPHVHTREDEAYLILEGRYRFHCAEEVFEGEPGSFVLLPKGRVHHYALLSERGRMLIWFLPSGMEGYFREMAHMPPEDRSNPDFVKQLAARYGFTLLSGYTPSRQAPSQGS